MVAICTGPAFTTDEAGNLVLAGERRGANPSPCALRDSNGLYTDPNGGVWATDQVYMQQANTQQFQSGSNASAPAIVPYQAMTQTYTNGTCWPIVISVDCTFGIWVQLSTNSAAWWEVGSAINSTNVGFYVIQSQWYSALGGFGSTDWFATHTQRVAHLRLAPHTSQQVTVQSRIEARVGTTHMVNGTYNLYAVGYATV